MFEPRFNPDHAKVKRSAILLAIGAVGALCGLGSDVSSLAMELGAEPLMSERVVDALLEVLFILRLVGLGIGFLGLAMLYDSQWGSWLCTAVGWLRLFLVADLYLLGFAQVLGRFGSVALSVALVGMTVAAMVMLFRVARLRFVYLGVAAWLVLSFGLSWLPLGQVFHDLLGVLGALVYAGLFGVAIFGSVTAKPYQPPPSPYLPQQPHGGYPPAGGGYPPY